MQCIKCMRGVGLGIKVVVIPFPAAGEDCFLVAHPECCPEAVAYEGNTVGYFLRGSGRFFVPQERVADLAPVEGEELGDGGEEVLRSWQGVLPRKDEGCDGA